MKSENGLIPKNRAMIVWTHDEKGKILETRVYCNPLWEKIKDQQERNAIRDALDVRYGRFPCSAGCCVGEWVRGTIEEAIVECFIRSMRCDFVSKEAKKEWLYELSKIKEFSLIRQAYLAMYVPFDLHENYFQDNYCCEF